MFLQINLLRVDGSDASIGSLLNRKYIEFDEGSTDIYKEILGFLKLNKDQFKFNPVILGNIETATTMNIIDLQCLRFMMYNDDLELLVRIVDNRIEVSDNTTEVIITNYNELHQGIPSAHNVLINTHELDPESVFRMVDENYKLFSGELFNGIDDPYIKIVDDIVPVEVMMNGATPKELVDYCTSTASYLGLEIFRITR